MPEEKNAKSILMTDDSIIARKKIKAVLKSAGYEVSEATNGAEAIQMLESKSFDLLMLDLLMPEVDGFEVLRHIKSESIEIPVVVLSADIQDATRELCLELGAKDFINKPPVKEDLLAVIEKAMS